MRKGIIFLMALLLISCANVPSMKQIESTSLVNLNGLKISSITFDKGEAGGDSSAIKNKLEYFNWTYQMELFGSIKRALEKNGANISEQNVTAPSMHIDFLSTYFRSVKYNYNLKVNVTVKQQQGTRVFNYDLNSTDYIPLARRLYAAKNLHRAAVAQALVDSIIRDIHGIQ